MGASAGGGTEGRARGLSLSIGWALMAVLGCSSQLVRDDLLGRPCPCVAGYVCDSATSSCVLPVGDAAVPGPDGGDAAFPSPDAGDAASPGPDAGASDAGLTSFEACAVVSEPVTAGACPAECSSCDQGTCVIRCERPADCAKEIRCPEGFHCSVECSGDDVCLGTRLICPDTYRCETSCQGRRSCKALTVQCTDGPCELYCASGSQICRDSELRCGAGACLAHCPSTSLGPAQVGCESSCNRDCACAWP